VVIFYVGLNLIWPSWVTVTRHDSKQNRGLLYFRNYTILAEFDVHLRLISIEKLILFCRTISAADGIIFNRDGGNVLAFLHEQMCMPLNPSHLSHLF